MKDILPPLGSMLWHAGGLLCHQLPERSPQFAGAVFPVCFRCAGLYLSLLSAFVFLGVDGGYRRQLPEPRCAMAISILTVPFLVDGWANVLGLWSSAGWVRALTGVGVGLVLPLFLVPLAQRTDLAPIDGNGIDMIKPGAMKPTALTPLALLPPAVISLTLLWLVVHPMRLWTFEALAVVASIAPAVFAFTFLLAGWRNYAAFAGVCGVASRDVPC